jgi:hypothetical protein
MCYTWDRLELKACLIVCLNFDINWFEVYGYVEEF